MKAYDSACEKQLAVAWKACTSTGTYSCLRGKEEAQNQHLISKGERYIRPANAAEHKTRTLPKHALRREVPKNKKKQLDRNY